MKIKKDIFNLTGKTALVFGGNGYLGKEFCKSLLNYGAKVYSCDLNISESSETANLKADFKGMFELFEVNATNKDKLRELKNKIIHSGKKIDIIVNTTTMKGNDFYLPFEDVSLEGWNIGLLGDLTIPFLTTQAFVPMMKKQRSGSIINIASIYGIVGNDQRIYEGSNLNRLYVRDSRKIKRIYSHAVYNAAKGGIISLTRYLAAYYGEFKIRVNCISPGGIYHEKENRNFVEKYSQKVPLGRKANPDEINGALIFLASDASSYVTGQNIVVDGGFTIW